MRPPSVDVTTAALNIEGLDSLQPSKEDTIWAPTLILPIALASSSSSSHVCLPPTPTQCQAARPSDTHTHTSTHTPIHGPRQPISKHQSPHCLPLIPCCQDNSKARVPLYIFSNLLLTLLPKKPPQMCVSRCINGCRVDTSRRDLWWF